MDFHFATFVVLEWIKRVAEMKSFFVLGGFCVVVAVSGLALMPVCVCAQEPNQDKPTSPLENLPTLGSKLTDSQVVMFADLCGHPRKCIRLSTVASIGTVVFMVTGC